MTDTARHIRHPGAEHIATFPMADRAASFAARIAESGWWVASVAYKPGSRTVRFTDSDATASHSEGGFAAWRDMLETVGYYGSDNSRKAKLDGVNAPRSY